MIILVIALKFMLLIECIKSSPESHPKGSKSKPHCSAGDYKCLNARLRREATLAIVDYNNRHHVGCDNHTQFCNVFDPLYGIKTKLKKSSDVEEFDSKVWPVEVNKPDKIAQDLSSQGNGNMKTMETLNSQNSDTFLCAEYGFFPDYMNPKMFYHCTPSSQNDGFVVNHKKCPSGLTFNGFNKKCDVDQLKINGNVQAKYSFKKKLEFTGYFPCSRTGLFPDKFNASMFWHCERNRRNGFTVTKMLCSDGEKFDPRRRSCVIIDEPISGSHIESESKVY